MLLPPGYTTRVGYNTIRNAVSISEVGLLDKIGYAPRVSGSCLVVAFSQITGLLSVRFACAERGGDTQRIEIFQNMIKPV